MKSVYDIGGMPLLDGEVFYSLKEAQIIVGQWVK